MLFYPIRRLLKSKLVLGAVVIGGAYLYFGGSEPGEKGQAHMQAVSDATNGKVNIQAIKAFMPSKEIGAAMLYCSIRFEVLGTTLESAQCFQNVANQIQNSDDKTPSARTMYYVARYYSGDKSALGMLDNMVQHYKINNPNISNQIKSITNAVKSNQFINTMTAGVTSNIKNAVANGEGAKSVFKLWDYVQANNPHKAQPVSINSN